MASDKQRQNGMIISATVLTAVSGLVVLTRLILRCVVIRKPGWDDLTIAAACLAVIAYVIELYHGKANHMGFPMSTLTYDNMVTLMKVTLAIEVTYYIAVSLIKISILLMYMRFAVDKWFRRLTIGTIIFHTIFFVVCIVVTTNQCTPLNKWWDLTRTSNESCINTTAFFYSTSAINILTDFWILGLPVPCLRKINRPSKEKFALMAVFGIGCFGCITSIIRLKSIKTYTKAKDPFRSSLAVNVWSMIEVNVAILCASVPALKPLFTPRRLMSAIRGSNSSSSSSSSGPYNANANIRTQNWAGYNRSGSEKESRSDDSYVLETKISSPSPLETPVETPLESPHERGRPVLRSHESMESIIRSTV